MKKALAILLVYSILMTLLVVSPFTANADEKSVAETGATSGTTGDCKWKIEGTKLTISGNGKMGSYEANSNKAPWLYSNITEIVIENGVTSIGKFSFYGCNNLSKVVTPDTVKGIGISAFSNCTSLRHIDIPNSITHIGMSAFEGCKKLISVIIPDSVLDIDNSAFSGCTELTNVTIGKSVTSIGIGAFNGCTGLTSVTIPDSVTSIGIGAFDGCTGLTSVTIGKSVTSINSYAFQNCSKLTNVSIPNSVTRIEQYAFYGCENLKSITIPSSVTYLDYYQYPFGYYYDEDLGRTIKIIGFTIYGYKSSEAERYANNNNFKFIALDDEPSDPTKTTDREIFGDIDGDGAITVVDSTFLQRYTIQAETPYPIGEKMK